MNIKKSLLLLSMFSLSSISYSEEVKLESLDFLIKEEPKIIDNINLKDLDFGINESDDELLRIRKLEQIISKLDKTFSNAKISKLKEIDDLYEIKNGKTTMYITKDGKYIIPTIAKIKDNSFEDIQLDKKKELISKRLSEIPESDLIKYHTEDAILDIYVFSDYTCPYCRKLHEELFKIKDLKINVNYIPYPRNGVDDKPAILGLQKIICSDDPAKSFDEAFSNPREYVRSLNSMNTNCFKGKEILHNSLIMGDEFDVKGTPYIFTKDGDYLGGWRDFETFRSLVEINRSNK